MPNEQLTQFPEYQCHKKVRAFKITEVTPRIGDVLIFSAEFPNDPVSVDIPWYLKFKPVADSYFVSYEDGYNSISPSEAFESGYSLIQEVSVTPISDPIVQTSVIPIS